MSPTWLHPYPPSHVQPIGDQEAAFSGSKAPLGGTKRGSEEAANALVLAGGAVFGSAGRGIDVREHRGLRRQREGDAAANGLSCYAFTTVLNGRFQEMLKYTKTRLAAGANYLDKCMQDTSM